MMTKSLILEPTSIAQWHALVEEARKASSVKLSDDLESYLIFLLIRFMNHPEIINGVVALDFLQNIKKLKTENQDMIRDVGDKCLLYSGLFPGKAKQKRVQISYYVDLGRRAYFALGSSQKTNLKELYANLCEHFVGLMDVLHSMRSLDKNAYLIDLLEAQDLWHATKSEYALNVIRNATDGFLIDSTTILKH